MMMGGSPTEESTGVQGEKIKLLKGVLGVENGVYITSSFIRMGPFPSYDLRKLRECRYRFRYVHAFAPENGGPIWSLLFGL